MEKHYQLSFEDIENKKLLDGQPGRVAYIDECGSFGFDFSAEGTSKHYILCAIIAEENNLDTLHSAVDEIKKNNGFAGTEMKSSKIGSDNRRRTRIISQLMPVNFRVILFVADKQEFVKGSPITESTYYAMR